MLKTQVIHAASLTGLALALILADPRAHAQASAPVPAKDASLNPRNKAIPTEDEMITMSEFTVTQKKTNDYVASETVTGTRLATLIRDLPFQVNVVTSEFMSDFATYTMEEELGYVSNFSPTSNNGGPILRGFLTVPYVDGFRRIKGSMPPEIDTDTTAVIKGPAASIYGQTVPGGVVNRGLRHPSHKQQSGIKLALGSNSTSRANAFSTGPLGNSGKLFYRASIENDSRKYDLKYAQQHLVYYSAQFLWKPVSTFQWNTRISYQEENNNNRTALPMIRNSQKAVYAGENISILGSNGKYTSGSAPTLVSVNPYLVDPATVSAYKEWVGRGFTNQQADGSYAPGPFVTAVDLNKYTYERAMGLDYLSKKYDLNGPQGFQKSHWANFNTSADKRWSKYFSTKATFDYFSRGYKAQTTSGSLAYIPNYKVNIYGGTNVPYKQIPIAYDINGNPFTADYYNDPNAAYRKNILPAYANSTTPPRYADGTIGTTRPLWTDNPYKCYAFQLDNAFTFKTGPVSHKLLVTFDYNRLDETRYSIQYNYGSKPNKPTPYPLYSNGSGQYDYPAGYIPRNRLLTDADFWYPSYLEYPELYVTGFPQENLDCHTQDLGVFVSERASFFKDHVHIYAGIRYDDIRNNVDDRNITVMPKGNDPARREAAQIRWGSSAWTPQCGISAGLTSEFVFFANYSTAYQPNAQYKAYLDAEGIYHSSLFPNEKSNGYEFGIRYSTFKDHSGMDRLNATLSYFYIDRKNVLASYTDPETGIKNYDASGEQDARGYDFDMNWLLTSSLQIGANWGHNDARFVTCALPYLIGTPTPGAVRNNYGFNARYSFKIGPLKGISVGGGVRYFEKSMCSLGSGIVYFYNKDMPMVNDYSQIAFYNVRMTNGALPFPNIPENAAVSIAANPATYKVSVSSGGDSVYNRPYAICDFWIKYVFRKQILGGRTEHSIQINLKNALDRFYTYDSGMVGDSRQIIFTYGLTF